MSNGSEILADLTCKGQKSFGENLSAEIEGLLHRVGLEWTNVDAVGVVQGPGTYTGLRLGVTVANAISQLTGAPVYGLSTLEAVIRPFLGEKWVGISVIPARKSEVNAALFAVKDRQIRRLSSDIAIGIPRLIQTLSAMESGPFYIVGDIPEELRHASLPFCSFRPVGLHAGEVAAWAAECLEGGVASHFAALKPVYSHLPGNLDTRKQWFKG